MRRNYSIYISVLPVIITLIFFASCAKIDSPKGDGTKDKASYDITLKGSSGSVKIKGDGVDSNWDSELGLIWLGMDTKKGPLFATINISYILNSESTGTIRNIDISTQEAISGTADELNGKLYSGSLFDIDSIDIGRNYITATFKEIPMQETTTDEAVTASGTITALEKSY